MRQASLSDTAPPQPYSSRAEFLEDLQGVLERDYGVELRGPALEEAGRNIDGFLRCML